MEIKEPKKEFEWMIYAGSISTELLGFLLGFGLNSAYIALCVVILLIISEFIE